MEETIAKSGEQPVFTVLVAAYNAEATIGRCLDSLLAQTERRIQIVCVDDASSDYTFEIMCEYSDRDSRVDAYSLGKNEGPGFARNIGLERARGLYTVFLDSDDWFSPDALEKCREAFEADERVDCVLFRVVNVYDDGGRQTEHAGNMSGTISGQEAFERSLTWAIHGVYAVRTSLHLRFPYDDTCRTYSDDNTTHYHYLNSRLVGSCTGTYYYYQHAGSVTHTDDLSRLDRLTAMKVMKWELERLNVGDRLIGIYETQRWLMVIDSCFFIYRNKARLSKEELWNALLDVEYHWEEIELWRVPRRVRWRPGLWPMRFSTGKIPHTLSLFLSIGKIPWPVFLSWRLFWLQERVYFSLRHLFGRDR